MSTLLLGHGSYFAIILLLILTGLGLPIPEEVAIIAAGVMSGHGQMNPWLAWASCMIGVLCGDLIVYGIGRHFGRSVIREHPFWARFVNAEREAQIERMIERHGLKVFFLARFLVGLRSPVYLTAGILRMGVRRFLLTDLFCATVVVGLFFLLSYFFGQAILLWVRRMEILITVIAVVAVGVLGFYLWRHYRAGHPQAGQFDPALQDGKTEGECVDESKHLV
ncbi:MAG: DedA family protein [Thermoguttaceae bacterium]|jgi:membrane protein DedA with SNARE-associated domain